MKINLNLSKNLPIVGIVGFSLASVWALFNLFNNSATHPTPIYWAPSLLVELISAWCVYMAVDSLRKVTKSNISKQDRRFYAIVMVLFVVVAVPTLSVSIWANSIEFNSYILGSLFPACALACAIGVALPDSVARFEKQKTTDKQERQAKSKQRAREKQRRQEQAQAESRRRKELSSLMSSLGKAGDTLQVYSANPEATQAEIAQELGVSRQAVNQHVVKLESLGLLDRSNGGVKVVTS